MLRDNLVGLIEPMRISAGVDPLALSIQKHASDDRSSCLENPRPDGAESSLTENVTSPFQAEPAHEEAHTINVSVHGALLLMTVPVEKEEKLLLINEVTQKQQMCRIVDTRIRDTLQLEVVVEFLAPHGEFLEYPPALDDKQPSAENRRYQRLILPNGIPVTWKNSRECVISRLDSLSMGGLFINAPDPPAEGDIIDLCFIVPGGNVRARGVIRHSHKRKGMGLQFTFMNEETRARLAHLLDKLLTSSPKT
jgi:hypothetical protein